MITVTLVFFFLAGLGFSTVYDFRSIGKPQPPYRAFDFAADLILRGSLTGVIIVTLLEV